MSTRHCLIRTSSLWLTCATLLAPACSPNDPQEPERPGIHMAELSADLTKLYLTVGDKDELLVVDAKKLGEDHSEEGLRERAYVVSRDSDEVDIIDLRTLELTKKRRYDVQKRVKLGKHPSHLSTSRDGKLLAVMDEDEDTGAVSFVDTETDEEVKRLGGFFTPHFMRFSPDGRHGFVANISAHHITRVDMEKLEIVDHIALDGFDGPPNQTEAADEGGFGDAQIDARGMLFAAHHNTGRVLVYDTVKQQKRADVKVGKGPWMAYAEHPFTNVPLRHLVTNFGDKSVSIINGISAVPEVVASLPGDEEAYGVNYSSRTPNLAFVMNRVRQDIAVVNTETFAVEDRIPVGGNTETAATSADGKYIVAAVSSANRVVVIEAESQKIVKTFNNVGNYPWSVTIPGGQNYCH